MSNKPIKKGRDLKIPSLFYGQCRIRTCGLQLRRLALYPTELIALKEVYVSQHWSHVNTT